MQRNAAGELVKPVAHSTMLSNASGNVSNNNISALHHVSGAAGSDASASVHRFKLYFPTSYPSSSADHPPSVQHRGSLTHVVVPYRGSLGDITLQWLADQAALRISKRYPQLVAECDVEGFDVVPLIFEPSSSGGCSGVSGLPQERRSAEGAIVVPPAQVPLSLTGWVHDSLSAYRLDLAMNGIDELDFYFSLPTHSFGFDHTAPPFELVLIWKLRDAAPARRGSTPVLGNASTGGSGAVDRAANHRPMQHQQQQQQQQQQLPPLVPPQRSTTPSRLPALEPRRPNEGAPRYRQSSPSPLGAPAQNAGFASPQVGGADAVSVAAPAFSDGAPSSKPKREPAGAQFNERSSASQVGASLRVVGDDCPSPPAPQNDKLGDNNAAESLQRKVDLPAPPPPLRPPSEAIKGATSRRNQATFVAQQDDIHSPQSSGNAQNVTRGLSMSPGGGGGVNDGSSRSPMCESDSEMNPDEFFTFQFQLLVLTEAEDRDTILLTEVRDRAVVIKEQQGERLQLCAAAVRNAPSRIPVSPAAAADDDDDGSSPRVVLLAEDDGRSGKGGATMPPAQAVKQGFSSPASAQSRSNVAECSPLDAASSRVFTTVRASAQRAAIDAPPPAMPDSDDVEVSPDPKTARAAPTKITTSSSSVETAALFASAPTSRAVLEAMRSKDLDLVRSIDLQAAQQQDQTQQASSDDEALMLACDELMQDWFALRHTVLTEERKEFRQLTQKAKQMQRILMSSVVNAICEEVLGESIRFGESSPRRAVPAAPESQLASPPVSLQRSVGRGDADRPAMITASSSTATLAAAAVLTGTSTVEVVGNPRPLNTDPPAQGRPSAMLDDTLIRLARIVVVSEEADRREMVDEETHVWAALLEGHMIHRKRVQLKLEQRYIAEERALLENERKLRAEIAEVEDRKFSMFAALCAKGILRIRASETQLDC